MERREQELPRARDCHTENRQADDPEHSALGDAEVECLQAAREADQTEPAELVGGERAGSVGPRKEEARDCERANAEPHEGGPAAPCATFRR